MYGVSPQRRDGHGNRRGTRRGATTGKHSRTQIVEAKKVALYFLALTRRSTGSAASQVAYRRIHKWGVTAGIVIRQQVVRSAGDIIHHRKVSMDQRRLERCAGICSFPPSGTCPSKVTHHEILGSLFQMVSASTCVGHVHVLMDSGGRNVRRVLSITPCV